MGRAVALQVAGGLLVLTGLGFGIPCVLGIRHLATTGEIWTLMGYPTYGKGPFERHRIATTVPLMLGFLVVCLVEVWAGARLSGGHRDGAVAALLLLPVEAVFWWGFALPIPPLVALVRTALLLGWWRQLR